MNMLVVVGSENPVKIKATKNVFKARYGECKVIGKPVNTGLPDQPIGLSQTLEGAVRRARQAIRALPDADFSIGIEAGLIEIPCEGTRYFDQQFAAVLDSEGWLTLGGEGPLSSIRLRWQNRFSPWEWRRGQSLLLSQGSQT